MEFRDLKKQYQLNKELIDKSIAEVISEGQFIHGPQVNALEEELADYVGVKHCISCANGTDALQLALLVMGVGENDVVFVPDFTFFSTGEVVPCVGAVPFFVDVKKDTFNIDPNKLENAIKLVKEQNKYTPRAVIAVDLFGQPAEYDEIRAICDKYKLLLIEDAAQGFGGSINGKKACSFGDISTTSFFPAKPLGCYGDGGAIFTDSDEYASLLRSLCVHGKNQNDKYDNIRIGMNSRLDTLQAAILIEKLRLFEQAELDDVNKVAKWYTESLKDTCLILPEVIEGYLSSWAQYTVIIPQGLSRDDIQKKLKEKGIPSMVYYKKSMHEQGAFADYSDWDYSESETETLCESVLSLPMGPYLEKKDVDFICDSLRQILGESGRNGQD